MCGVFLIMKLKEFNLIKIYDHPHDLYKNLQLDQQLETTVSEDELLVRFWVSKGVVFGKLDSTLSNFRQGEDYLNKQGYPTAIRKAGGLAVIIDEGTLNMSFIFKKQQNILESYETVVNWLIDFFKQHKMDVQVQETPNSYCPGKFDLVHRNKKFCGIAQIRSKHHVIVMLNLVISGDQNLRLGLIKKFYEISNIDNKPFVPKIQLDSMRALEDWQIVEFIESFKQYLSQNSNNVEVLDKK